MDKKSIIGIAVVAVLFLGFAYMNTKEQEKYQQEMARWQAYQDSLAAAAAVTAPAAGEAVAAADSVAAFREEEVLPRVRNTVFSQIVFLIAFFVSFNPEKIITLHKL